MSENDHILSIIAKQLKGLAAAQELQELHLWLQEDASHQRQYDDLMQIWHSGERVLTSPAFDTRQAWSKIEGQLNKPQATKKNCTGYSPAHKTARCCRHRIGCGRFDRLVVVGPHILANDYRHEWQPAR